jgi:hypothetical protein
MFLDRHGADRRRKHLHVKNRTAGHDCTASGAFSASI